MSDEIIKVLDYIGTQLGIAIDWSAENVMPQVMDILSRYRVLKIISNTTSLVVCLGLIFIVCYFIKKSISDINAKAEGVWYNGYDISFFSVFFYMFGGCAVIASIIIIVASFSNLLHWAIVPEMGYLKLLQGLVA